MMKVVHNRLGDPNTGGGYGTIAPKASGKNYTTQSVYPYHEKRDPIEEFSEEDEEMSDAIMRKTAMSSLARGATTGRTDRGTFTKMRLDLMEAAESEIMSGMVPFPFSHLYKKFSGPLAGGFSTAKSYTTGPGKNLKSTDRGWSKSPTINPVGDKIEMRNIGDMIDPGIRSLVKANLMLKMPLEDSE
jgi:hypothetical protein